MVLSVILNLKCAGGGGGVSGRCAFENGIALNKECRLLG